MIVEPSNFTGCEKDVKNMNVISSKMYLLNLVKY